MAAPTTLAQALLAFQAEGVTIQKDLRNPHFKNKYPGLDGVLGEVVPVLNKCGLVVMQLPTTDEGMPALTTRIIHAASGESVESTMRLLLAKQDPQAQGAGLTYARRYALMAFLGLVADEDTDGHTPTPKGSSAGTGEPKPDASGEAPASRTDASGSGTNGKVITDKQRERLYAIAGKHSVPVEESKRIILEITGQESSREIPMKEYDAVISAIGEWVPFG